MRFLPSTLALILFGITTLYAQTKLPPRVNTELEIINDPKIIIAIDQERFGECIKLLTQDLKPVPEGKFTNLDSTHRRYISKIRLLRLMLGKDEHIITKHSKSKFRSLFPDGKIKSFWLWMSRDEYIFPSTMDQTQLINKWKSDAASSNITSVNFDADINDWWF